MPLDRLTPFIAALTLLGCAQPASSSAAEQTTLPATAETAGALDNNDRAPDPRKVTPVRTVSCDGGTAYCPSAEQVRADRSFSAYAIDTPLSQTRGGLTRIDERDCAQSNECDWRDQNGARHFLLGDNPADLRVVIKVVNADEFLGRSIGALGIGAARRQAEVLANIRSFLPDLKIDCDPQRVSGNVGPVECSATLNPGWIQIGFDRDGNLLRVRFDGYQFT